MTSFNSDLQKTTIMFETAQHLITMIRKRNASRFKALDALQTSAMDNLPEEVVKMRESESAIIRAVMQEQNDLIEIIEILFPPVKNPASTKPAKQSPKKRNVEKK